MRVQKMKKKGFTLIEMIVVITIVGVLAAVLVPAMIGYVRRSKLTAANNTAKSVFNALAVAMVEMESIDLPPQKLVGDFTDTGAAIYAEKDYNYTGGPTDDLPTLKRVLYSKVCVYFNDVAKAGDIAYRLNGAGAIAVGVIHRGYPGSYPPKISIDKYMLKGNWTESDALSYAMDELSITSPDE